MHNVYTLFREVKKDAISLDIPFNDIADVIISKRAKRRFGSCKYNEEDDAYYISVSEFILDDNVPIWPIKETLMHELIHSCDGCMNHGDEFKKWANIAGKLGYKVTRTKNRADFNLKNRELPPTKYSISCTKCGHTYHRSKMCKLVKTPERFRCGECGNRLIRVL